MDHAGFPVTLDGEQFTAAQMAGYGYITRLPQMLNAGAADFLAKQTAAALSAASGISTSTTSLAIGTGPKTLTVQAAKGYAIGHYAVIASTIDPTNRMSGIVTGYNSGTGELSVLVDRKRGSGTIADWTVTLSVEPAGLGKQTLWVPAEAMKPRSTNGATAALIELATNKNMIGSWDFDPATIQYVQFGVGMPKGWDEGTFTFRFLWSHPSTTTNFGVVWGIRAVATSNADAIDAAFGTAVTVNDVGGTTRAQYTSDETAALTVAGTPAELDVVRFELYRGATDATYDTLAVLASLEGVWVHYTTDALSDD